MKDRRNYLASTLRFSGQKQNDECGNHTGFSLLCVASRVLSSVHGFEAGQGLGWGKWDVKFKGCQKPKRSRYIIFYAIFQNIKSIQKIHDEQNIESLNKDMILLLIFHSFCPRLWYAQDEATTVPRPYLKFWCSVWHWFFALKMLWRCYAYSLLKGIFSAP